MSGTLPYWLERMLGIPRAAAGEGTAWELEHSWSWAPWVTLVFVALAAGFITICYLREAGSAGRAYRSALALARFALVAIVAFMIAGFVLSLHRTGLPYVVVVLDESASMGIADRYDDEKLRALVARRLKAAGLDQPTRLDLAKTVLVADNGALLRGIEKLYKLKVYFLSATARSQSGSVPELVAKVRALEPTGPSSRLGHGVRTVLNDLRGTPPTAVVLVTDGINTEGETLAEAAAYARRKGVPLFTVGLGSEAPARDLELGDLLVDEVVFVEDVVNFEAKLTATGFEGRRLQVVLREKDRPGALAETTVTAGPAGTPQKVRLPYRPTEVGEFEYTVEVENLPEEVQLENNRQKRLVSVRDAKIRVLFVQSYPNYEFRYLKHLLERDKKAIELKTVLQEADLEYALQDPSALRVFPVRREELFEYDVLIFGDVNPAFLSASVTSHIQAFVAEKGGGLIFVAGPLYTPVEYRGSPLATLLPIEFEGAAGPDPGEILQEAFQVQPTELGLGHPAMQLGDTTEETLDIWRKLPPLYWLFEAPSLKPAARVLAEHPVRTGTEGRGLPIFALQYVGSGKVLFHATDETWRWRYRVGDVFFARYWVQTIRYLSRSKLLGKDRAAELTVDRREYRQGEPVRIRVRFVDERLAPAQDDGVTVVLEREGDRNRRLQLRRNASHRGIFEGVFTKPVDGSYHAWLASPLLEGDAPAADFQVVAPPGELERLEMDAGELKRASEATKGRFYTLATAAKLLADLPEGRQVKTEPLPPLVLWNQWPVLAVFLGLLVGEWILRKHKGML